MALLCTIYFLIVTVALSHDFNQNLQKICTILALQILLGNIHCSYSGRNACPALHILFSSISPDLL
jgi:hypothetical protein